MFILLFLLWLILNGRVTGEILLIGVLVTGFVSFFLYRLLGYPPAFDRRLLRNLPLLLLYVLNLIREIFLASFQVLTVIWSPSKRPDPVYAEFHSGLTDTFSNVLLTNSITLTPGTYTVVQEEDRFIIHCLRREYAEDLNDSSFIRLLRRMRP